MAASAARTRPAPKAKPAYKPRLQVIDLDQATFAVQSERDPLKRYITNGRTGACNCWVGMNRPDTLCKHGKICLSIWPHLIARRDAALAAQRAAERPALRVVRSSTTEGAIARYGGAAGLLECFGGE